MWGDKGVWEAAYEVWGVWEAWEVLPCLLPCLPTLPTLPHSHTSHPSHPSHTPHTPRPPVSTYWSLVESAPLGFARQHFQRDYFARLLL
ncbi:MAG: hypothetical protein F6J93_21210 [Oscillatoria sp. SIO1A7]|nr:hypothetical protein [Oscillatoria sp. SIO1A7]